MVWCTGKSQVPLREDGQRGIFKSSL